MVVRGNILLAATQSGGTESSIERESKLDAIDIPSKTSGIYKKITIFKKKPTILVFLCTNTVSMHAATLPFLHKHSAVIPNAAGTHTYKNLPQIPGVIL